MSKVFTEAEQACIGIFNTYSHTRLHELGDSIVKAWFIGMELYNERN